MSVCRCVICSGGATLRTFRRSSRPPESLWLGVKWNLTDTNSDFDEHGIPERHQTPRLPHSVSCVHRWFLGIGLGARTDESASSHLHGRWQPGYGSGDSHSASLPKSAPSRWILSRGRFRGLECEMRLGGEVDELPGSRYTLLCEQLLRYGLPSNEPRGNLGWLHMASLHLLLWYSERRVLQSPASG